MEKNLNALKQAGTPSESGFVSDYYNHCFWMGDFNYRINMEMEEFVRLLKNAEIEVFPHFFCEFYKNIKIKEIS